MKTGVSRGGGSPGSCSAGAPPAGGLHAWPASAGLGSGPPPVPPAETTFTVMCFSRWVLSDSLQPHVGHSSTKTNASWFFLCFQTAVDVFRRIILEAEKIDGAASQGKSSCSVM